MSSAPPAYFCEGTDALGPEGQQIANRKFLHDHETSYGGLQTLAKFAYANPKLKTHVGRLELDNPLMVGAGWDKFGDSVKGLVTLGFSAVEVGTIPLYAQDGNPPPRHFVLEPGVMLNSYGFNSPGAQAVKQNLDRYKKDNLKIGINVGKNKMTSLDDAPEAHARAIAILYDTASFFVINVSSPNTHDVRKQQARRILSKIVAAVQAVVRSRKPVFIKIAPELSPAESSDVIEVVIEHALEGIIASNTTNNSVIKAEYGEKWRDTAGGLSGDNATYRELTNRQIRFIHQQTKGRLPIIGVGGIQDAGTALEKIKAGASALQIVTALNFCGPSLPGRINRELVNYMDVHGINNVEQLIGADA